MSSSSFWQTGIYDRNTYALPNRFRSRKLGYMAVRTDTIHDLFHYGVESTHYNSLGPL